MGNLFFNSEKRLRNGWWALIFLLILMAGLGSFRTLIPAFKRFGIRDGDWVIGVMFSLSMLATLVCTRLRKESMASAGWQLNRRWGMDVAKGTLFGAGVMLLAAGLLWAFGGVTWELNPLRSLRAMSLGFLVFIMVALWEENLFRGFLFQRLIDGIGEWPTQILLALLFAMGHWGNPGMQGAVKYWATLDIALAAVFLGLAYLRTRSLALPIGIHLGWNWTQGNVLGFGVSGTTSHPGWIRPIFNGKPEWMSGGTFGIEASVFGVVAVLIGIVALWKWKGSHEVLAEADQQAN